MREQSWARFSLSRVIFWIAITGLAVLFDWIYAVAFVSVCSLYANIASDFAGWRADRNPTIERLEAKLDKVLELLGEPTP